MITGGGPVAPRVGLEPGQVIAGFQVHDARGRIQPIDTDLAGESAVLGPHDRFGDSVLQQINSRLVHCDRFIHPLDRFELRIGQHGFADRLGPLSPGLGGWPEWQACFLIDGTADSEVFAESLEAFEDQDMGSASDQIGRRFFLGAWLVLLAIVELRAFSKVGQLMAR